MAHGSYVEVSDGVEVSFNAAGDESNGGGVNVDVDSALELRGRCFACSLRACCEASYSKTKIKPHPLTPNPNQLASFRHELSDVISRTLPSHLYTRNHEPNPQIPNPTPNPSTLNPYP